MAKPLVSDDEGLRKRSKQKETELAPNAYGNGLAENKDEYDLKLASNLKLDEDEDDNDLVKDNKTLKDKSSLVISIISLSLHLYDTCLKSLPIHLKPFPLCFILGLVFVLDVVYSRPVDGALPLDSFLQDWICRMCRLVRIIPPIFIRERIFYIHKTRSNWPI